ncbi:MAG TPA: methylenetetrahydrofolate reductase [Dongiaceae bacterium]|nr:methylenetetrahydrofolate reductase [Dongiaceae bacterium]
MKADGQLARRVENGEFIVTAEHAPRITASLSTAEAVLKGLGGNLTAVNMGDNQHGVAMSSLAASAAALKIGLEPVLQMVTRDRNRIALQSDLLGAASLGIKNVLCLSGYHQTLIGCPEAKNVFDIDSTQFIAMATRMCERGLLADGTTIDGPLSMLVGAVINPFLKPLELNLLTLHNKIEAGARFIQTHAVFDLDAFSRWLEAVRREGLTRKVAILASVLPLESAMEAQNLRVTHPDFYVPEEVIAGLQAPSSGSRSPGWAICVETIKKLKAMDGVRGVHILSGGKEAVVPDLLAAAGLS